MDTDTIFSFSSPLKTAERIDAIPSPVLELVYAAFFLADGNRPTRTRDLPWVRTALDEHPKMASDLAGFWAEHGGGPNTGLEVFIAACQLGYARDPSPDRFLEDMPGFPGRALELAREVMNDSKEDMSWLVARFETLRDPQVMDRYRELFVQLWNTLEPLWQGEGEAAVRRECRRFRQELAAGKTVIDTLPRHFFARSEKLAEQIRTFSEKGRVTVSPIYFSAGGGFAIDTQDALYIGYSLRSETFFKEMVRETEAVAGRLKAFADPTRLLILAMIDRFEVTVSDLAERLDVSQPTVSGHLKILREAGLVEADRRGNKSYYRVRKDDVRGLLREVRDLLLHS